MLLGTLLMFLLYYFVALTLEPPEFLETDFYQVAKWFFFVIRNAANVPFCLFFVALTLEPLESLETDPWKVNVRWQTGFFLLLGTLLTFLFVIFCSLNT